MKKNKKLNLGDIISVDVVSPNRGKFPIGRYNGVICKLTLVDGIKYLEYGCTVKARVMVIYKKCLHVLVESVERSAETNQKIIDEKIKELLDNQNKAINLRKQN